MFRECFVSEKIHGTSAAVGWRIKTPTRNDCLNDMLSEAKGEVTYFSGGEKMERFKALFNDAELYDKFSAHGYERFTLFGEACGGSQQGMSKSYGKDLKFIVFDVKIDGMWLSMDKAAKFATDMGFEFVWYTKTTAKIDLFNYYRDQPSIQAFRNGMGVDKISEGIVIRPLIEVTKNNGRRIMAKHKRAEFSETKTPRKVKLTDEQIKERDDALSQCEEWCTENRLTNILSHIEKGLEISDISDIIRLMIDDILTEGKGEVIDSKALRKAVARETALMCKKRLDLFTAFLEGEITWQQNKNV